MTTKKEWKTIQKDYTHGITTQTGKKHYPTLQQLSQIYNIPQSTIHTQAAQNQWTQKRKEAKNQMSMEVFDEKRSVDGGERSRVERLDSLCDDLLDLIEAKILVYKEEPGYIKESQLKCLVSSFESAQRMIHAQEKRNELYQVAVDKFSVTRSLICSKEHIDQELSLLSAVRRSQGIGEYNQSDMD